jgi:Flp pilus assembly protein TadB
MHAYHRPLVRRTPNAAEKAGHVLLLGLVLFGLAAVLATIVCFTVEPHVIVAALVLGLLFLVFRLETRPQRLAEGAFYPSRMPKPR